MDIQIRRATTRDLNQIEKIEETLEHRILSSNVLKDTLNKDNYYYLIATIDNVCVAYLAAEHLVDHMDLLSIAVSNEYRRHSIATMLIQKLLDTSKKLNVENIFLEVRYSNTAAIKFYEKVGFEKITSRKNYYKDTNEDAYIYIKKV